MESRAELQKLAETIAGPWNSTLKKPPFSFVDMITLALLNNDEPMDDDEIINWIQKVFPYYDQPESDVAHLIHSACVQANLPAVQVPAKSTGNWDEWDILVPEARIYLQTMLEKPPRGKFPFLQLPPELRNIIYEMVFKRPSTGLKPIINLQDASEFLTMKKSFEGPFSTEAWEAEYRVTHRRFYRETAQEAFSPLLVNKQIFEEAHMHFYFLNTLYFDGPGHLAKFIGALPPHRRQYLSHLAFIYETWQGESVVGALQSLASLPRLRKLYIEISEPDWQEQHYVNDEHRPDLFDPLKIPGIQALGTIRGLDEVVFSGDCPVITASLKPLMERKDARTQERRQAKVITRSQPARALKSKKMRGG